MYIRNWLACLQFRYQAFANKIKGYMVSLILLSFNSYMVFYLKKAIILCRIMTSIKDWVFSQVISKSVGATRPLSTSESFLSQDSQNELPQDSQDEELGSRGIAFCFIILVSNLLCSSHEILPMDCKFPSSLSLGTFTFSNTTFPW